MHKGGVYLYRDLLVMFITLELTSLTMKRCPIIEIPLFLTDQCYIEVASYTLKIVMNGQPLAMISASSMLSALMME